MTILFIIVLSVFAVWSYTLVDLNLTLLNWQPYLSIQSQLIQLGYFNRQLNATILLLLLIGIALYYMLVGYRSLALAQLQRTVLITGIFLSLGYTAFSHDLFNYIFDSRMITVYGVNPYHYTALDFPNDEWIRFMQWTHRTYPYGPTWLLLTIIPSFLGLGKFLFTYTLFKLIFLAAYLTGAYYTYQILKILSSQQRIHLLGLAAFAFNPLILIDGLLSPHLDMVMASLGLVGIYFAIQKKWPVAWIVILFSAGIKFATLPWLFLANPWFLKTFQPKIFVFALFLLSMLLGIAQAISQTNYQPWYGLLAAATLPLLTPYIRVKYILIAGILLSLPMWIYVHHSLTGEWASAIPIF